MKILVTGANRGIGLEFCRQLLAQEFGLQSLVATVRDPSKATELQTLASSSQNRLHIVALDLATDDNARTNAAGLIDRIKASGLSAGPLSFDGIINNAGIYLDEGDSISSFDFDVFRKSFEINTLGAFKVLKALDSTLARGARILQITSLMGSLSDNRSGGSYAYRSSKAALNMMNLCYAQERKDVTSVVIHPGWVQTDMGGRNAQLAPEESVAQMLRVFRNLKPSHSGRFFNYDGSELPW
ncbi:MAG: SDR family oxidoreductase [Proteobacteria bacterium]|nr:SDR family oxidoreductase [Pseudomonadota bacterium]